MVNLRGQCTNTEFCSLAAAGGMVTLPDTVPFVCPKCNEPLQTMAAMRSGGRRRMGFALQLMFLLVLGVGASYYYLGDWIANPQLRLTPQGTKLVSSNSLAGLVEAAAPPEPPPAVAPPAPVAVATPAPLPAPVRASMPAAATAVATRPAPAVTAASMPAASMTAASMTVPAPPPAAEAVQGTVLLRFAGSGVLGNTAMRRLATAYLALIGDSDIRATTTPAGATEIAGSQLGEKEVITITPSSTSAGLGALLRGRADFAMAARRVSQAELERMAVAGDLTSPTNEHVVGVQGIAAIVSPANRVPSLTVRQLRGVLSGQIRDWAELGGLAGAIRVVLVDARENASDAPQGVLTGLDVSASAQPVESETAVAAAVAGDPAAIGLVSVASAGAARALALADGGAAIAPTPFNIASEDYPLTRRIYLYATQTGPNVRRFAEYTGTPAGQTVVEASGITPLTIRSEPVAVADIASDRLRQALAGTSRLSVVFRFNGNGTELDSRSVRDFERLAAYARAQRGGPSRLLLAGFADNSGTAAQNGSVSQKRLEAVLAGLGRAGVTPGRYGAFGADDPVADNATAEGRERNRRVEVYVLP